jgi:hypothetical protein
MAKRILDRRNRKRASLAVKNGKSLGQIVASWEYPENAHDTLCMVDRKAQQVA